MQCNSYFVSSQDIKKIKMKQEKELKKLAKAPEEKVFDNSMIFFIWCIWYVDCRAARYSQGTYTQTATTPQPWNGWLWKTKQNKCETSITHLWNSSFSLLSLATWKTS